MVLNDKVETLEVDPVVVDFPVEGLISEVLEGTCLRNNPSSGCVDIVDRIELVDDVVEVVDEVVEVVDAVVEVIEVELVGDVVDISLVVVLDVVGFRINPSAGVGVNVDMVELKEVVVELEEVVVEVVDGTNEFMSDSRGEGV